MLISGLKLFLEKFFKRRSGGSLMAFPMWYLLCFSCTSSSLPLCRFIGIFMFFSASLFNFVPYSYCSCHGCNIKPSFVIAGDQVILSQRKFTGVASKFSQILYTVYKILCKHTNVTGTYTSCSIW